MSVWGDTVVVRLRIPAHLSRTGVERDKNVDVDRCIAPLVRVLNEAGIHTVASCCGHGKQPGNIALADGRELIIAPDFDTARAVDRAFPPLAPSGRTEGEG